MSNFIQSAPPAQRVLDSHASVVAAIEVANKAMIDVVRKVVVFDEAMAANLLGCSIEKLRQIADMPASSTLDLVHTSIPIWSIRLAEPEFAEILDNPGNGDAALEALLRTFSTPPLLKPTL